MTLRLYYTDATLLAFDAVVVAQADDPLRVVLDQTAFYPTSGGQPHDTGMLGHVHVVDVVEDGDQIVHILDASMPLGPVRCVVDADRRRDHMEQHTAQHLLSALAADRLGWETASVHFGPDHSAIEFAIADARAEQLVDLEAWAAKAVAEARPVSVGFEEADAAVSRGLRKPPTRDGEIRVITIDGLDRSACGGTHVANTAALGPVWITEVERLRGNVRVSFLAGGRARARARSRDALVRSLALQLSCAIEELEVLVPKRQEELHAARSQVETLERELARIKVQGMAAAVTPNASGIRCVVYRAESETTSMLRAMAQAAGAMERTIFVATVVTPPSVYLGASADSGVDAGAALKGVLVAVGGRGGGSPRAAQGTTPDAGRLREVVAGLLPEG